MARGRGLITEAERRHLRGEGTDQQRYEAASRVRARIQDELTEEIQLLEDHHDQLLEELKEVVCEE